MPERNVNLNTFFVSTAIVVVYSLLLCATRHHVIIKLAPPAVSFGVDEDNVMSTMVIPTVHQHCMQGISG
jgi:hypothetical protein